MENKVVVKIFGEEYPIIGSKDPAYISKVADYVDSRMQEVAERTKAGSREKVAILTSLSLASELLDRSLALDEVKTEQNTGVDNLLFELDKALTTPSSEQ